MQLSTILDYCDHPVHRWPSLLDEKRERGSAIVSRVYWGVHETAPGMRDFSRASQRGLEQFLGLLRERGLKSELHFGFAAHPRIFPGWVWGVEEASLVPDVVWNPHRGGFGFMRAPSLRTPALFEGFLGFLSECFNLVALYEEDDAIIDRLVMDFGIYESDANLLHESDIGTALRERYESVTEINSHYGTTFRDFESAASFASLRLLFDRRPWLAAFDYRWCRAHVLGQYWEQIFRLAQSRGLSSRLASSLTLPPAGEGSSAWRVAVDGVFVDVVGESLFPLAAEGGKFHPSAVRGFRFWDYLRRGCERRDIGWLALPLWEPTDLRAPGAGAKDGALTVICGKYLSLASFLSLRRFLEQGGHVFFPVATAQYDERMRPFEWPSKGEPVVRDGLVFRRVPLGEGALWAPSRPLEMGEGFFDCLERHWRAIEREEGMSWLS